MSVASQNRVLPTQTLVNSDDSLVMVARVLAKERYITDCLPERFEDMPKIAQINLVENDTTVINNKPIEFGHSVIQGERLGIESFMNVDANGFLWVFGLDADRYSINADGYLEYNFCI